MNVHTRFIHTLIFKRLTTRMRRVDIAVPQLSLTRKKSVQVPTNDRQQTKFGMESFHSSSHSRITINSLSRVTAQHQSRVSATSISREAYMVEQRFPVVPHSSSNSRLRSQNDFQQDYLCSNVPSPNREPVVQSLRQNVPYSSNYDAQLLSQAQSDRHSIQFEMKMKLLFRDIEAKSQAYKGKMARLLEQVEDYDKELSMMVGDHALEQSTFMELDEIRNQSLQLGRSCLLGLEEMLTTF